MLTTATSDTETVDRVTDVAAPDPWVWDRGCGFDEMW